MRGYVWCVVVLLGVASAWALSQDEAQAQYASCGGGYAAQPVRSVARGVGRGVVRLLGFERRQARREARRAARASYSCFGSPVSSVGCGG